MVEPQPFWDNFKLGFGPRVFSLMKKENLSHDDLFRVGGNLRHRRQVGRFYQIWSGSYNSIQFRRAKKKWYSTEKTKDLKKVTQGPKINQNKLEDPFLPSEGYTENKNLNKVVCSKQKQLIEMLGPKKDLSHSKGQFTEAFYKSVMTNIISFITITFTFLRF